MEKNYVTINTPNITNYNKQIQTYLLVSFTLTGVQLKGAAHSSTIEMTTEDKN